MTTATAPRILTCASYATPLLLALGLPLGGAAQQVRGSVTSLDTGHPVSAALVRLENEAGPTGAETLTNMDGAFNLRAPVPGRYRLSVERIGMATERSAFFELGPDQVVVRHLEIGMEAIALEGIRAIGERRCSTRQDAGDAIHQLWDEARKMLSTVTLLEDLWYVSFRVRRWERDLDPEYGAVRQERYRRLTVLQATPFESRPAEELVEEGFVRTAADSTTYYGPDGEVLLSDAFLDGYCFQIRDDDESAVGLAFEPMERDRNISAIEGVFWLDRESAALDRIEFEYTNLAASHPRMPAGGAIEFGQLENGAWIIERWNLRMPRYAIRDGMLTREIALMHESGGEVLDASVGFGEGPWRRRVGTLSGRVVDASERPVGGAVVFISGTDRADTTAADGSFRLASLPSARYVISWLAADDPAGERSRIVRFRMPPRDTTLELRADRTGLAERCPAETRRPSGGVLLGTVRGRSGLPLPGTLVHLQQPDGTDRTVTDEAGRFRFCAVPSGSTVRTAAEDGSGSSAHLVLADGDTARVALVEADSAEAGTIALGTKAARVRAEADAGPGRVTGTVLDGVEGGPVAGAAVRLGEDIEVITDRNGRFLVADVPPGALPLQVSHVAHDPLEEILDVGAGELVQLELRLDPLNLEPLTVTVRRRGLLADVYWRADRGLGGEFITDQEIESRAASRATDVLRGRAGIEIVSSGTGRQGQLSIRGGCAPMVYLDGTPVTRVADRRSVAAMGEAYHALNMVSPASIEMVEIYRGASQLPGIYSGSTGMCGAIGLWTRRGR